MAENLKDTLIAFNTSSIWTLAPFPVILAGGKLMQSGALDSITWLVPGEVVEFLWIESKESRTQLRVKDGALIGECSCPEGRNCRHHIGTIMAVCSLLKGTTSFGHLPNKDRLLGELKTGWLSPAKPQKAKPTVVRARPPDEGFLVICVEHGEFFCHYLTSLRPNAYSWSSPRIPAEVAHLCVMQARMEDLIAYLEVPEEDRLRCVFSFLGTFVPFQGLEFGPWVPNLRLLNDGETVLAELQITHGERRSNGPFMAMVEGWLAHCAEGKLYACVPRLWTQITKAIETLNDTPKFSGLTTDHFRADWEDYEIAQPYEDLGQEYLNSLFLSAKNWVPKRNTTQQHSAPHFLTLIDAGGAVATPVEPPLELRVEVEQIPDRNSFRVVPVLLAGETSLPHVGAIQGLFANAAMEMFITKRQVDVSDTVVDLLFQMLCAKTQEEFKMVKAALRQSMALARAYLSHAMESYLVGKWQIWQRIPRRNLVALADGTWGVVEPWDHAITLMRLIFQSLKVRLRSHQFDLEIPEKEFPTRMRDLMRQAESLGVTITLNGAPLSFGVLDISVQSNASDNLDWFEAKPEVLHRGQPIAFERWKEIIEGGFFKNRDGSLTLFDPASLTGLRKLHFYWQSHKPKTAQKNTVAPDSVIDNLSPRLQMLDWLELRQHGIKVELPPAHREVFESLLSFSKVEPAALPAAVKATLRDYQKEGFTWLSFLYRHHFGACLADDMGLGKTLQTICLLAAIHHGEVRQPGHSGPAAPFLIVLPTSLLFNWRNEIAKFCPSLRVADYTGAKRVLDPKAADVFLTTYETARRDIEKLKQHRFEVIVFDEAQAVKNMEGERAMALRTLQANFKMVLTGTPLENRVHEYFAIMDLAVPGIFGKWSEFKRAASRAAKEGDYLFLHRAKPFLLRRTKEKILKELPPKTETDRVLELSTEQKKFYTRLLAEVKEEVLQAYAKKDPRRAGIIALSALTKLRQVCVSPAMLDPNQKEVAPKLQFLREQLEELAQEGHSALVFSQFTKALDLIELSLEDSELKFLRLDGSTPSSRRMELVQEFQSSDGPRVFLISLKAGGAGLNLTKASYVFHVDPWWNPAVENQASDRAHRIGQTQRVFIQRLLMRSTIEEKIMVLKARKRELFEKIMAGAEERSTAGAVISREDFDFLIG